MMRRSYLHGTWSATSEFCRFIWNILVWKICTFSEKKKNVNRGIDREYKLWLVWLDQFLVLYWKINRPFNLMSSFILSTQTMPYLPTQQYYREMFEIITETIVWKNRSIRYPETDRCKERWKTDEAEMWKTA